MRASILDSKSLLLVFGIAVAALLASPLGADASLVLSQETNENDVDTAHTVTAVAANDTVEAPLVGIMVTFEVLSGPNAGTGGTCSDTPDCTTDTTGTVSFTYTGSGGAGTDLIGAWYVMNEVDTTFSNQLEKIWIDVNRPPVALCQDVTEPGGEDCQEDVSIDDGSFDPDGDEITLAQEPAGPYPLGETPVSLIVTDEHGASDTCMAVVTIIDDIPPEITVELNRDALWPPNHKMVEVCAEVTVTDECDPSPTWVLTSVTSNEPDNTKKGGGDGNTVDDIQNVGLGSPDECVLLRSERRGPGDGRIYTLGYTAMDSSGNMSTMTATVEVPHDQSGHAMAANGHGLFNNSAMLQLVVPSIGGFDAGKVIAKRAYVGNQRGVVSPESWRLQDVIGDERPDLVLTYSRADLDLALAGPERGGKGSTDLHYRTEEGENFLVKDISVLAAIDVPDAPVEDDPGGSGDPGSDPGKEAGEISVEVFDVQGRIVRSFTRDSLPEDFSRLGWDGRDVTGRLVPQGIYFYRIQTPTQKFVRKITILR